MQNTIANHSLETLLALYNQEIDKLKEKLLNGDTWENTKSTRKKITELAVALQKSYNYTAVGENTPIDAAQRSLETIRTAGR
jgi:hypothetical protein